MLSVKEFEQRYRNIYNEYSPNAIVAKNVAGTSALKRPLERPLLFLSKEMVVDNKPAFLFWQFNDWKIADALNSYRGIDRFIYMPGIGIVGGAFDYYFRSVITDELAMSNYLNESLMKPRSINGSIVN